MSRLIISNDSGGTCADHVNCVHLRRRLTCIPYPSPARLSPRLCRCQCLRALLDLGSSCVAVVCLCPSEFHYNLQQGHRLSFRICSILLAMVCRCPSDVANRCERSWHKDWWCPYWESRDWNPSEWCHIGRRFFRLGRELTNVTVNGRPAREILDFDEQCVRCGSWNVEWHTVGLGFGGECLSCRAIQP